MTVDKIEPLDKRRSKVFIDGDFAFVLYNGEIRHYHIEAGQDISEPVYEEILHGVICKRAREKSLYLLKSSGKTESEVRQKLRSGHYPEEAVEEAVSFLNKYHYLDDREYARNYIELYGSRKSRTELMTALLRKGIDKETIVEFCDELQPDSSGQIKNLLKKRRYDPKCTDRKEQQKHMAYLLRKGFSFEDIRSAMGAFEEE